MVLRPELVQLRLQIPGLGLPLLYLGPEVRQLDLLVVALHLERVNVRSQLVQVLLEREVGGQQGLALLVQGVDVLGQVGDHGLQALQLGDALAMLGNEPSRA